MLWLCLAFSIVFFILATVLGQFSNGKKTPLTYPNSGLSDDLFVSQNTEYIQNEALTVNYTFKNVPYIVDLLDGKTADIEEGHLVHASDDVVFYVSEFENGANPHDVILEQYPQAIYMNYAKQNSFVQTATTDIGFINGYYATYFVDHLLISTGPSATSKSAYMIGYVLDLGTEYDYDLIVSVATTTQSTENFEACKEILDNITNTVRLDEKLAEKRIKEAEEAFEKQQKAMQEVQQTSQGMNEMTISKTAQYTSSDLPVALVRDFKRLSMIITWANPCEQPAISFETVDGLILGTPSTLGSRQAIIEVGAIQQGNYILNCSHYLEAGDINVKLIEN